MWIISFNCIAGFEFRNRTSRQIPSPLILQVAVNEREQTSRHAYREPPSKIVSCSLARPWVLWVNAVKNIAAAIMTFSKFYFDLTVKRLERVNVKQGIFGPQVTQIPICHWMFWLQFDDLCLSHVGSITIFHVQPRNTDILERCFGGYYPGNYKPVKLVSAHNCEKPVNGCQLSGLTGDNSLSEVSV